MQAEKISELWTHFFGSASSVPVAQFVSVGHNLFGKPALSAAEKLDITAFVAVLDKATVQYSEFFLLLVRYGPPSAVLTKLAQWTTKAWFQPYITTQETERLLSASSNGVFLIRWSSSSPNTLTISYRFDNKNTHTRITPDANGKYIMDNHVYDTIEALLGDGKNVFISPPSLAARRQPDPQPIPASPKVATPVVTPASIPTRPTHTAPASGGSNSRPGSTSLQPPVRGPSPVDTDSDDDEPPPPSYQEAVRFSQPPPGY